MQRTLPHPSAETHPTLMRKERHDPFETSPRNTRAVLVRDQDPEIVLSWLRNGERARGTRRLQGCFRGYTSTYGLLYRSHFYSSSSLYDLSRTRRRWKVTSSRRAPRAPRLVGARLSDARSGSGRSRASGRP